MPDSSPLIVVANDDTLYLELVQELLANEGYRAIVAPVVNNAYHLIQREQPNLIILDIHLQQSDTAWLLLDLIRLNPKTTHIPMLVCSANTILFKDSIARLNEVGCETLIKPFRVQHLLEKVRTLLDTNSNLSEHEISE